MVTLAGMGNNEHGHDDFDITLSGALHAWANARSESLVREAVAAAGPDPEDQWYALQCLSEKLYWEVQRRSPAPVR